MQGNPATTVFAVMKQLAPKLYERGKMKKMKKKMYIFHRAAMDNGTVATLTDKEADTIYGWIKNLPEEIEFWLAPAKSVGYKEILNAIDAEVHDQLKKEPFLPLRPMPGQGV